jgi:hypothetical protein
MVRTRAGNQAIFVILDGFSKFVAMYPVRRITSKVVVDILLKRYFPTFGLPKILVSGNAAGKKKYKSKYSSFSLHPYAGETSVHCLHLWVLNKTNYTTNGHGTKCPTFQAAQNMFNNIRKQNSQ